MRSRPTIKDIAAEVGVSHTTVSYIMNGNSSQKISDKTREAVLAAAKRLQYVPNGAARSLRSNSTHCISVALEKSMASARFGNLLQGIREGLHEEGYGLMLFDFGSANALYPDYISSVLQRRTDGIIYVSSDGCPPPDDALQTILANGLPFVACDCCPEQAELASVSFDYERGAFEVACRLFGEGARRILYWRPSTCSPQEDYREAGIRRAVSLYPDVEFSVAQLPVETVGAAGRSERNLAYRRLCSQYLAQDIIPHITGFAPGDAVICSWGIMVYLLSVSLNGKNRQLKLASLSDIAVPIPSDSRILLSQLDFMKGGEECTGLLMRQLRGEGSDRILIAPSMPAYSDF